jgi:hypothetical protein
MLSAPIEAALIVTKVIERQLSFTISFIELFVLQRS